MASPQGRTLRVHVAAFGKHPGWDDHIEEIGLDCDALVRAKRVLYSDGIAGNIDSGSWEKLADEQRLPTFAHHWYWKLGQDLVVGRMWSSRDGKGRTKYPMVVCAMIDGASPAWAIERIHRRLAAIEESCVGTQSAELVRLAIGEARRALEDEAALESAQPSTPSLSDAELLKRLVQSPELNMPEPAAGSEGGESGDGVGLVRILYEMDREMGPYLMRVNRKTTTSGPIHAQHIRVPKGSTNNAEAARAWMALMGQMLAASSPLMLIEPREQPFIDVIVGDPKPAQLFCVRAGLKGLPLTSSVPYTIDPAFMATTRARIADWVLGKSFAATQVASPSAAAGGKKVSGKKALMVIGGAGVLFFIVLLLIVMFGGKGKQESQPGTNDTSSKPTQAQPAAAPTPPVPAEPAPGSNSGTANAKPTSTPPQASASPAPAPASNSTAANAAPVAAKPVVPPALATPVVQPASPPPSRDAVDPRAGWNNFAARQDLAAKATTLDSEWKAEGASPDAAVMQVLEESRKRGEAADQMRFRAGERDAIVQAMSAADAATQRAKTAVDAASAASSERLAKWIAAQSPPVADQTLAAAWRRGVGSVAPSEGWEAARARIASVSELASKAEAALRQSKEIAIPSALSAAGPAIRSLEAAAREQAATRFASGVEAKDAGMVSEAEAKLKSWTTAATGVLADASAIEGSLSRGAGLAEADEQGMTVAGRLDRVRASEAFATIGASLSPVIRRVEALSEVGTINDPAALLAALETARQDQSLVRASEVITAWERLGALEWPRTPEALAAAGLTLSRDVSPVLERVEAPARRESLQARADATARAMWTGFAKGAAPNDATFQAALDGRDRLMMRPEHIAQLPETLRYNLLRREFAGAIKSAETLAPGARVGAQQAAAAAFVRDAGSLAGLAARPEVAGMIAALAPITSSKSELDLSKLGPGSAKWKLGETVDDRVTFVLERAGQPELKLEFVRVEPAGSEDASFVATSEAPLSLVIELLPRAGGWPAVQDMLTIPPGGADTRAGARVWRWGGRTPALEVSRPASATDALVGWARVPKALPDLKTFYAGATPPESPTLASPMQGLTAHAAALTARLAGCRLPTSAEWSAARAKGDSATPNLRDQSWKQMFDRLRAADPNAVLALTADVFRLTPMPGGDGADSEPAVQTDDGTVWFRPVDRPDGSAAGSAAPFRDLVGNVAELVFEDSKSLEQVAPTRAAIAAAVTGDKLRIVGGSALSPAAQNPTDVQKFPGNPVTRRYTDLGFRLAFTAPRAAGAAGASERLSQALASHGYVSGQ